MERELVRDVVCDWPRALDLAAQFVDTSSKYLRRAVGQRGTVGVTDFDDDSPHLIVASNEMGHIRFEGSEDETEAPGSGLAEVTLRDKGLVKVGTEIDKALGSP